MVIWVISMVIQAAICLLAYFSLPFNKQKLSILYSRIY